MKYWVYAASLHTAVENESWNRMEKDLKEVSSVNCEVLKRILGLRQEQVKKQMKK